MSKAVDGSTLAFRVRSRPEADDSDRTFHCNECGSLITVGTDGTEYGHARGRPNTGTTERCPRRPESVDPVREGGRWNFPGGAADD